MATNYERQLDRAASAELAVENASATWFRLAARDGVEAAFMADALDAFLAASEDFLLAVSELHWAQVAAQHAGGNGRRG